MVTEASAAPNALHRPPLLQLIAGAAAETFHGVLDWRRWGWLGLYDLRLQNRRSFVGIWWPTLSLGLFAFGVGFLFAALMDRPLDRFLPHLALGWLTWTMISGGIVGGSIVFITGRSTLEEARIPLNTLVLRFLARHTIQWVQGLLVIAAVFLFLMRPVPYSAPLAIIGFLLNLLVLHGAMLFLGVICARFRDIQHLIEAGMRFMFFMTPIMWMPDDAGAGRSILVDYNPFYYMLEVVRGPIESGHIPLYYFGIVGALAVVANVFGIVAMGLTRQRMIYWL